MKPDANAPGAMDRLDACANAGWAAVVFVLAALLTVGTHLVFHQRSATPARAAMARAAGNPDAGHHAGRQPLSFTGTPAPVRRPQAFTRNAPGPGESGRIADRFRPMAHATGETSMNRRAFFPLLLWAIRDNARRPGEACLLGIALAVLVALSATPLLLTAGLEATVDDELAMAPSLVVRRLGPGGWMPIPGPAATEAARKVPGVVRAWPRIWGVVPGPDGPLTVVAWTEATRANFHAAGLSKLPRQGEAVAGDALAEAVGDPTISLATVPPATFRVVGRFPKHTGLITHDMLLVHPDDARRMLALGANLASDLAVEVFYPSEQTAILPDLARAFPWPVRIVTRAEAAGRYAADLSRRGGIAMVALVPAVAALVLLVTATVREHLGKRVEIGLLKAMGWTTPDVAWFMGLRAAMVGLPAAALGTATAYAVVFWPGTHLAGAPFLWMATGPARPLPESRRGRHAHGRCGCHGADSILHGRSLADPGCCQRPPPGRFLEGKKSDA